MWAGIGNWDIVTQSYFRRGIEPGIIPLQEDRPPDSGPAGSTRKHRLNGETMGTLEGKSALITGAGRGFGYAIARRFIDEGANVALNFRSSRDKCDELAAFAQVAGQRAITIQADITDRSAVTRMVEEAVSKLNKIDILVNNAGVMNLGQFSKSTKDQWRRELETNIFGTLGVTREVLPGMIAQNGGRVINLSSQLAIAGWDQGAVYAGSKGFVLAWTRSLAHEVGQYGITVNTICPGSIQTDMNASLYASHEAREEKAQTLPLRRLGTPDDVAECAVFFASDAANYLTGQYLGPNGGNVM